MTIVSFQFRYSSTHERDDRGEHRAGQLHQAGADEIPDAFGVGHDARDQDAGLGRVEVADRQAHHVRLDVLAHLGDRALRGDAEHLRVGERRRRIDDGRRAGGQRQRRQQFPVALLNHVVHQVLGRRRQHEAGQAIDEHQAEAEREPLAVRPDEGARFFPGAGGEGLFRRFGGARRVRAGGARGGRSAWGTKRCTSGAGAISLTGWAGGQERQVGRSGGRAGRAGRTAR